MRVGGWLPFAYPPPFLIIVWPFSLMPFAVASRSGSRRQRPSMCDARTIAAIELPYADPAVLANAMTGQNGYLTRGCSLPEPPCWGLGRSLQVLSSGLLVIKPQLALLLPFALLAGRDGARSEERPFHRSSWLRPAPCVRGRRLSRFPRSALPIAGRLRNGWPPERARQPLRLLPLFRRAACHGDGAAIA